MAQSLAAQMVLGYIEEAEVAYACQGDIGAAAKKLLQILEVEKVVEGVDIHRRITRALDGLSEMEVENHQAFTSMLARGLALALHMGDDVLAHRFYTRVLAWADDSVCGSQTQHDEIVALWKRHAMPWWKRPVAAFQNIFSSIGEYEMRKQGTDL